MKRKLSLTALILCLALSLSFLLTACYSSKSAGVANAKINEKGELVLIYEDGSEKNLGAVSNDGITAQKGADGKDGADGKIGATGKDGKEGAKGNDGSITIISDGSSIPTASSKGLRSAVSIVCKFQATVQQGGWYPGSSQTTTKEYSSAGSGVIYQMVKSEGDAFIITNYHVVYDASSNTSNGISDDIKVYLYGSENEEKAIKAFYVGGSLYYDIAVLSVVDSEILKESSAAAVDVSDSDEIAVGDSAIAIGNAKAYGISASYGIVSVDSEYITMTAADEKTKVSFRVMRVDTAINSGNSGGGLYDDKGNLIGIVNAKIIDDGVENIGYAIPSNIATAVADNIIDYCCGTGIQRAQRAAFGITVTSSDTKAVYNSQTGRINIEETVSVYEVTDGSLSDGVLQTGDVLVSATVGDKTIEITRQYHVIDMMIDVRVGDIVTFNIIRNGKEMTLSITITKGCLSVY